MTTSQTVRSALACAVEMSASLADLLRGSAPAEGKPTEDRLRELQTLLEALPPGTDPGTLCFLRNWTADCRKSWLAGEACAARYQMQLVNRVLRRLLHEV
jgi:hypothetical protein